ncbi:MetQ/NlpA family ABC transporter substrate-binding protein [Aneurinibacillus sp. Ricciae_BoGa-3]|uniref:MetQ/NlpA family ABC transporter substrate-binding protein n=1 Tax=Aneurinibacillus sp. Ricciae_BoGa-3 TaxID=3022697 RepID=UPI002341088B|nr:MetQ/NlpA family ABC transporter substrate-binding protein [Aneurinibacillus sp. Ricciae_BoGa-3]WCK55376.1 MetQ/NlpA family ABC transporter substrate-binding protein [Aneurinibacillus sp. Ricciae_BoGa-3]
MKKWIIAVLMLFTVGVLSACGNNAGSSTGGTDNAAKTTSITVGASAVPHAEILNFVKDKLKQEGVDMKVQVFNDYVLPNMALEDKQIDANYFQTVPYLDDFNKKHNTHIAALDGIHFEPMGLFGGKQKAKQPKTGAVVAIPDDTTNTARALKLLETTGWIKLTPTKKIIELTPQDIVQNPYKIIIKPMKADILPRALSDVDYAVINGNNALNGGLKLQDAVSMEKATSEAAKTFANIISVKKGDENNPAIQKLIKVLKSDDVKKFINDKYKGAVVAVF